MRLSLPSVIEGLDECVLGGFVALGFRDSSDSVMKGGTDGYGIDDAHTETKTKCSCSSLEVSWVLGGGAMGRMGDGRMDVSDDVCGGGCGCGDHCQWRDEQERDDFAQL